MCPAVLRASWPGAALSDPGLENALWPQQTNLSPAGEGAPSATEQPAPGQGCQVVDDLQSSPSEQISGKIQNRSSLDGSFLQPSPVCSSGHCQSLWGSISNPFFKHSSQADSLLESSSFCQLCPACCQPPDIPAARWDGEGKGESGYGGTKCLSAAKSSRAPVFPCTCSPSPSPSSSPAQGKANATNPATTDTSAAHLLRLNLDDNNVCVQ